LKEMGVPAPHNFNKESCMKHRHKKFKSSQNFFGFTLLELMVGIGILAILVAIAVPSYRQYIIKARRSEAYRTMNQILIQVERYYVENNNTFPSTVAEAYGNLPQPVSEFYLYYLGSCAFPSSTPCLQVDANAIGSQANDIPECRSLKMDTLGRRQPADPQCWNQ
jgi:type IV pilus assembly protein PilE